jgi:hypothetical protein
MRPGHGARVAAFIGMRGIMALACGIAFAAGCVGDFDSGPGLDPEPEPEPDPSGKMGPTLYKRDVHPATAKCSGSVCHSIDAATAALGKWWTDDKDAAYGAITGAPSIVGTFSPIAPILTHIEAGHRDMTYSSDEQAKIVAWLAAETEERANDPMQPPPFDAVAALQQWSGCMKLENFQTANMAPAWGNLVSFDQRKCLNCHQGGGDGFVVDTNAQAFFTMISTDRAYLLKYFSVDGVERKIVINTGSMQVAAELLAGHPKFNPTTNAGMTALQLFYDATVLEQTNNTCDPPRLTGM